MPSLTEKPDAGFRHRTNGIRCYGDLVVIANEAEIVAVEFGTNHPWKSLTRHHVVMWVARPRRGPTGVTVSVSCEEL